LTLAHTDPKTQSQTDGWRSSIRRVSYLPTTENKGKLPEQDLHVKSSPLIKIYSATNSGPTACAAGLTANPARATSDGPSSSIEPRQVSRNGTSWRRPFFLRNLTARNGLAMRPAPKLPVVGDPVPRFLLGQNSIFRQESRYSRCNIQTRNSCQDSSSSTCPSPRSTAMPTGRLLGSP